MDGERTGGTARVAVAFLASMVGSVGFAVAYQIGAGTQWLAVTLALAFGGLGAGLAWWSRRLMPQGPDTEQRASLVPPREEEQETAAVFRGRTRQIQRRGLLGGLLAGAAGALGISALWPVQSLGPQPGARVRQTGWGEGAALVDEQGQPVTVDTLAIGSALTVFPQGRDPTADDQVILLRVPAEDLTPPRGRDDWSPHGYVAYSKVCTHAGCPVGLYQNVGYLLLCPCHQATFDVVRAATPVFGPAPRALPQLPLRVAEDGRLIATGDFSAPIGPDRWRRAQRPRDAGDVA